MPRFTVTLDGASIDIAFDDGGNVFMTAEEGRDIGLIDAVTGDPSTEIARLRTLDAATTRLVKELTIHADRLSQRDLLLLAQRLGTLYEAGRRS